MAAHLLGLVCAIGGTVFTATLRRRQEFVVAGGAFVVSVVGAGAETVLVGSAAVLASAVLLARPRTPWVAAVAGGSLGGLWVAVLGNYGMSPWLAGVVGAAVLVTAASCGSRDPRFAPAAIREDALLVVAGLGVATAAAPALALGWTSAGAMNLATDEMVVQRPEAWVLALMTALLVGGGLHTLWRRG